MTAPEPTIEVLDTILGPIEVGRQGAGKPVLIVHGTPGGHDVGLKMGRFLVDAGFEVIAPSRPGYPETPLLERRSIDSQADLMAALLVELGHPSAGILTWSGGGPVAYRLAARHPQRVTGLVALNALSKRYLPEEEDSRNRLAMKTILGDTALNVLDAYADAIASVKRHQAEANLSDEELRDFLDKMQEDLLRMKPPITLAQIASECPDDTAGVENDVECLASIDSLALEEIRAPALIIDCDSDTEVSSRHSDHAAARIPNAERIVKDDGSHSSLVIGPEAGAIQARVIGHFNG